MLSYDLEGIIRLDVLFHRVLAIETSCDDTSVAIVNDQGYVETMVSASQDGDHEPFGGVVPEIAGRNHTLNLLPLIEICLKKSGQSWKNIHGIAVTSRPGLLGSLIVGLITAKALALSKNIPFLGVNHLEGHLLAPFLKDDSYTPPNPFDFPFIALAVSGGHTHLYWAEKFGAYHILGQSVDDAVGEAFDKFAKMLGLGFPGGVKVDQWAQRGDPRAFSLPRPMLKEKNFQMSFSGLKASALRLIEKMSPQEREQKRADLCASYQEAICDVLIEKLDRATRAYNCHRVVLTGGVSANSRLRKRGEVWAQKCQHQLLAPPIRYCTDNAAMIGYVGIQRMNQGEFSSLDHAPSPQVYPEDFVHG